MKTGSSNIFDYEHISDILNKGIFSTIVKPVGKRCNLNCSYCYYRDKSSHAKGSEIMNAQILEEYIRQYIQGQDSDSITFCWHGGEPTVAGLDYFRKAVELQKKYSEGKEIINTFQTNGTSINPEWCKFFNENKMLVGLSIDGPPYIHDRNRKWGENRSSFEAAYKASCLH